MQGVNVKSEIGNLKKVILHRPGDEWLNLTPNTLEELRFDDIPVPVSYTHLRPEIARKV